MNSSDQFLLEIRKDAINNLKKLDGKKLKTFNKKEFSVAIHQKAVAIVPRSTGKLRPISIETIIMAYQYLREENTIEGIGSGRKSIRGLGFSEASPAYVWAILSNFEDVQTDNNKLFWKKK